MQVSLGMTLQRDKSYQPTKSRRAVYEEDEYCIMEKTLITHGGMLVRIERTQPGRATFNSWYGLACTLQEAIMRCSSG